MNKLILSLLSSAIVAPALIFAVSPEEVAQLKAKIATNKSTIIRAQKELANDMPLLTQKEAELSNSQRNAKKRTLADLDTPRPSLRKPAPISSPAKVAKTGQRTSPRTSNI